MEDFYKRYGYRDPIGRYRLIKCPICGCVKFHGEGGEAESLSCGLCSYILHFCWPVHELKEDS